jgi:hypothetical protein
MAAKYRSPIDKAKGYELIWSQVAPLFEATRQVVNASFVYVIGEADDGPLKIGKATDPIIRLRSMQTGNPRRLRLEYVLVGDIALEKLLHDYWETFAILSARGEANRGKGNPNAHPGTEWFKPEARDTLLPIIADAANRQVELLSSGEQHIQIADLEQAVRDAHAESDFVPRIRDEVTLHGAVVGTVTQRPSRI